MCRVPGLNEHGCHGTATLVESGFHCGTASVHIRVGTQIKFGVRGQQHGFQQLVDIGALLGGNVDEHGVATVLFRNEAVLGELATDLVWVRARLINLVDGPPRSARWPPERG